MNPKNIDLELLKRLKDANFKFEYEKRDDYSILKPFKSSKDFRHRNPEDILADKSDYAPQKLFSSMNQTETRAYLFNIKDVTDGISNYKAPKNVADNYMDYEDEYTSIKFMGNLHGLCKKQYEVFQVYASKMVLRILDDRDIKLLDESEKELRISLLRFFKDTPVRGILIGPAGTGKSRTLTCFFHWMCLW